MSGGDFSIRIRVYSVTFWYNKSTILTLTTFDHVDSIHGIKWNKMHDNTKQCSFQWCIKLQNVKVCTCFRSHKNHNVSSLMTVCYRQCKKAIGLFWNKGNKTAIADLQCKSNATLIAALFFLPNSGLIWEDRRVLVNVPNQLCLCWVKQAMFNLRQ